jgi:hypothetical protein
MQQQEICALADLEWLEFICFVFIHSTGSAAADFAFLARFHAATSSVTTLARRPANCGGANAVTLLLGAAAGVACADEEEDGVLEEDADAAEAERAAKLMVESLTRGGGRRHVVTSSSVSFSTDGSATDRMAAYTKSKNRKPQNDMCECWRF